MARRTRRTLRNPTPIQWVWIGVGAAAIGTAGYFGYRSIYDQGRKRALGEPSAPPDQRQYPEPRSPDKGGGAEGEGAPTPPAPECGHAYPGFVPDGVGCVPGQGTPAGIYVAEKCSDFVFVEGETGPQLDYLEDVIAAEAERTKPPSSTSADPTRLATDFFMAFWGECQWPPPPTVPQRIVQLYQALVYVIGHEIVAAGGRVVGTTDPETVDEQIAERLEEIGMFDFNPDVVPEINIPSAYGDEATGNGEVPSGIEAFPA